MQFFKEGGGPIFKSRDPIFYSSGRESGDILYVCIYNTENKKIKWKFKKSGGRGIWTSLTIQLDLPLFFSSRIIRELLYFFKEFAYCSITC